MKILDVFLNSHLFGGCIVAAGLRDTRGRYGVMGKSIKDVRRLNEIYAGRINKSDLSLREKRRRVGVYRYPSGRLEFGVPNRDARELGFCDRGTILN